MPIQDNNDFECQSDGAGDINKEISSPCSTVSTRAENQSTSYRDNPNDERFDPARDLNKMSKLSGSIVNANRIIAFFTFVMAMTSIVMSIISYNQWSVTSGQLNVMNGQLELSRNDQRAWVGPKEIKGWNVVIQNYGKTPAMNVRVSIIAKALKPDAITRDNVLKVYARVQ
jgi:hypothetical protein